MHLESINDHNLTGIATVVIALCIYNFATTHPVIIIFLTLTLIIIGVYIIPITPILTLMYFSLLFVAISRLFQKYYV